MMCEEVGGRGSIQFIAFIELRASGLFLRGTGLLFLSLQGDDAIRGNFLQGSGFLDFDLQLADELASGCQKLIL